MVEQRRSEFSPKIESMIISPETLLADNRSEEAVILRKAWDQARRKGELYILDACGDARVRFPKPERYVTLKSIAAGGHMENVIIANSAIQFAVVSSHFDGGKFEPGQMPTGCGGLGAKDNALKTKNSTSIKGIHYYIEKNILHPDPLIQALLSANKITKETGKPSLAVIQNHRTTKTYPIGVFLPGQAPNCAVNSIDLFSEKYDPKEIYAKGIPELENESIPDIFRDFIEACEAQVKELLLNFPNLNEMQRVQNPKMIIMSTEIMSAKIRYPKIANFPGTLFKLHLPRVKNGTDISIKPDLLEETLNQMEYPIKRAVDNFGKPDGDFSETDTSLIETDDIALSRKVALNLAEGELMKKWLDLPEHEILIAQTQEGITQLIDVFTP